MISVNNRKNPVTRPRGLYVLDGPSLPLIYGPDEQRDIAELVDICAPAQTRESLAADPSPLAEAEVLFSGWGAPVMDAMFLAAAPRLRAVFYGAGSIRSFTTAAFWERDVVVTSAYAANALPVAEYALGTILLSLKNFWSFAALTRQGKGWHNHTRQVPGNYGSTVGLISFGAVARELRNLLRPFSLRVMVYDPFLTEAEAQEWKVERAALDEIFCLADVVSLHTPQLPATVGLIEGRHFTAMKIGACFINTARGAVVREGEMIDVLRQRQDITAVLDVTDPEPPRPDSPLLYLPNVVLTPHIAGSLGPECRRLGRYMVEELQRYVTGQSLRWQITEEKAVILA